MDLKGFLASLKEHARKSKFQILILLSTLALFLITNELFHGDRSLDFIPPLFGVLIAVELVVFVGMEVKDGAKKHGWKHEIVDTIIALGVAVGIWILLSVILNTSAPISGVVSCSMLPNLQRGDFVFVQGAPISAYSISMSAEELNSLTEKTSQITYNNETRTIPGSIFPYCLQNRTDPLCNYFVGDPNGILEKKGAFTYKYQMCPYILSNGSKYGEPCLRSVSFKGKEYLTNFSNDVVVYQPKAGDVFARVGDIVHRVMFKIDVDGRNYYLTRGDNNPILDLQVYDMSIGVSNSPISQDRLKGKVIFRVPYLGYFKLFISGFFNEDPQCKTQLEFDHVN